MSSLLHQINEELRDAGSPKWVASTQKFAPTARDIFGVSMPVLNDMAKRYQEGGFELVAELWASGSFEARILSGKLLNRMARRDPDLTLKLIKKFSKDISDWAVCDCLGTQATKKILKSHREQIFELSGKLVKSKRMWERRLGLVLLEGFTKEISLWPSIKRIMKEVEGDDAYYVQKAVAWLNRNFEKRR